MIKKKDYELIAEAYDAVLNKKSTLNECWDEIRKNPKQLKKVEDIVGTEGHEKNNDYHMEMQGDKVVIKHKIKGSDNEAERDIIVDKDGEENVHVHQEVHKESKDSIASHATFDPDGLIREYGGRVANAQVAGKLDHAALGGLAAANYVKSKKQGLIHPNPYDKKSEAAIEWQKEFDKVVNDNDELNKKAVESGDVPTKDGSEVKESYLSQNKKDNSLLSEAYFKVISEASEKKCKWCTKGCRCGGCKGCTPSKEEKDNKKVCSKCHMLKSKCKCK